MDIVRLMLLSRQMKNRRHEKNNMVTGIPPLNFTANKTGMLKNYRIYGNTETLTRSYSGTAPLSFPIVDGAVSNYRIYGNTVNGESVGDRTGNLFDISAATMDKFISSEGVETNSTSDNVKARLSHSDFIAVSSGSYITMQYIGDILEASDYATLAFCWYDTNKSFISRTEFILRDIWNASHTQYTMYATVPNGISYCIVNIAGFNNTNKQYMFNPGSTALPYEPYGYKIPITNNSETANIYLGEPLRKVGNEAEYVDYATQKWHRVRKNLAKNNYADSSTLFTVKEVNNFIHVNGTNNSGSAVAYVISKENTFPAGLYDIVNNSDTNINYDYKDENGTFVVGGVNANSIKTFNFPAGFTRYLNIYRAVSPGLSIDFHFQVMIVKHGNDTATYEPYISNTEVDVTLPALPAQSSANSLSVGTSVQPSSVAVDVGEVVSCGDKVTDNQNVNYGKYKIPVTLTADSAETTDIYLNEPLAKSGDIADYIDYMAQKRHNSDGTESSVTLPEIAVTAGTNTFTVGTEVQPSRVELTGRIKEAQTNGSGNT